METGMLVAGFIIGYFVGHYRGWNQALDMVEEEEEYGEHDNQSEKVTVEYFDSETNEKVDVSGHLDIIIEVDNNCYFVYDKHKSTFMAQGKSKEELEDALVYRYPNKLFNATPENLEELGFNNG